MNQDLEKIEHALVEFSAVDAGLAALRAQFAGVVFDVTTPKGMADAKAARAAIREPRYQVERIRKDAKAPLLALTRRLDREARRITDALLALEEPIDAQVKAEEERIEREREAKIAAEAARVDRIRKRIVGIERLPFESRRQTAAQLAGTLTLLQESGAEFGWAAEFAGAAHAAHAKAVEEVEALLATAQAAEAEAARLKAEREELERQRTEQARRDAEAKALRDAEERAAREAREAEERRLAEERTAIDRERAALAAERAAEDARRQAERDAAEAAERARVAAEEAARAAAAEADRVAAEAIAEVEAKVAATEAPAPARAYGYPGDAAIVECIAREWQVTGQVAAGWLAQYGREREAA